MSTHHSLGAGADVRVTVDVVVPSYRRPTELKRCLEALGTQTRLPARVIVVARPDDVETRAVVDEVAWDRLSVADVYEPGLVAAMRAGVAATSGSVIAFTDDDAAPASAWIEKMSALFERSDVAAVGGRDVLPHDDGTRVGVVGKFRWYGKLVGEHHRGEGPPRPVDCLKGVNMAFRASHLALARPGVLKGEGAQEGNEPLVCSAVRESGGVILYDPSLEVRHNPAPRWVDDERGSGSGAAARNLAHNLLVSLGALNRGRGARVLLFNLLVGGRATPGIARAVVALVKRDWPTARRLGPSALGTVDGLRTLVVYRHAAIISCDELRRQGPNGP